MIFSNIPSDFIGGLSYILRTNYKLYLEGASFTLIIAITGTFIGLFVAMLIIIFRIQEKDPRDNGMNVLLKKLSVFFSTSYVEFFRGTPMMVQAAIFYYGLAMIGVRMPIIVAGIIVVSLNTAAYLTEVLRSGINAIDKGQMEAARAIGLSRAQAYRYIIFPQVIKNMVPAIGNELVVNIKDTAVLSVIGVSELFYMAKSVAGTHYRYTESFVLVALVYLIMVLITTRLLSLIIKLLNKEIVSIPTSQTV